MGGSSSKEQTVGYKYYLGIHLVLCHGPVDSMTKIIVGDKTAWTGTISSGPLSIDQPELFGGDTREGGVSGTLDVMSGDANQPRNGYLQSILGASIPAFRGVFGVVLRQFYLGLNPYLKTWAFRLTRINIRTDGSAQWYGAKAAIGPDMNPAHIIHECLTSTDWGMGYPIADIDDASFSVAADTLYDEGMGISLLWDKTMLIDEFIGIILKHIDGSLYVNRSTGKFNLTLTRADYDIDDLDVYGENQIERIVDFKRSAMGELVNSVTVSFWDTATEQDNSITIQDISLIAKQGCTIATTLQFPGFTNPTIANKVAARELQALSAPLAKCVIYFNRSASKMNIGNVFVLSWPRLGISQLAMRVANIELGELTSNLVKITAIEDVFALPSAVYAPPPSSEWTNPINAPAAGEYNLLMEAPYWDLARTLGDTAAQAVDPFSSYFQATSSRPSGDAFNSKIAVWDGVNFVENGNADFTPVAKLGASMNRTQTTVPLYGVKDASEIVIGSYVIIGTEYCSVVSLVGTLLTIGRGVLDTVPVEHPIDTAIFFAEYAFGSNNVEYAGGTVTVKLLTVTPKGTLPIGSAVTLFKSFQQRAGKPYPPARVQFNGVHPANSAFDLYGPLYVAWFTRNRLTQTVTLYDQNIGNIGLEPGTTYSFEIRDSATNTLEYSSYGTTSQAVNYEAGIYPVVKVIVWTVLDSRVSYQKVEYTVTRRGFGFKFGEDFGGVPA